jgi:hypothetical protein
LGNSNQLRKHNARNLPPFSPRRALGLWNTIQVRSLLKKRRRRAEESPSTASASLRATRSNDLLRPVQRIFLSWLHHDHPLFLNHSSSREPSLATNPIRPHKSSLCAQQALQYSTCTLFATSSSDGRRTRDPEDLRPVDVPWPLTTCYAHQLLFYRPRRRILHDLGLQRYTAWL